MFLLVIVHVVVSLMLIFIILLQAGRSGMTMGLGGSSETIFGTQGGTLLTRLTAGAAIIFMCTSIALTLLTSQKWQESVISDQESPSPVSEPAAPESPAPAPETPQSLPPDTGGK